jgi:hypothetical protein
MATKRKAEEPRKDASGRELFPWEIDPADQTTRHAAAEASGEPVAGGAQQDTGDGGGDR